MERRPYFVFGDVLSNLSVGAVAGFAVHAIVSPSWSPWVGMPVGMVLGMLASVIPTLVFVRFFGAFEIMLPVMLTGMLSGMLVGMTAAMFEHDRRVAVEIGAATGFACLVFVYALTTHAQRIERHG